MEYLEFHKSGPSSVSPSYSVFAFFICKKKNFSVISTEKSNNNNKNNIMYFETWESNQRCEIRGVIQSE